MSIPPGAVDLRPTAPTPKRMVASTMEQALVGTLKGWAVRAVLMARLERQGMRDVARHDVWLVKS